MAARHQQMPISKQFANFTNATAGLDLTLRFIHAIVIIVAETSYDKNLSTSCVTAALELAIVRRYLRFFGVIDCLERTYRLLFKDVQQRGSLTSTLQLVESTCLGLYLLLEDMTILHDMNISRVSWYSPILVEANKFWFYSICAATLGILKALILGPDKPQRPTSAKSKKQALPPTPTVPKSALLRRLIVNLCDLTLPASFVGWVAMSNSSVGWAMLVSTVLFWSDLWTPVQIAASAAGA